MTASPEAIASTTTITSGITTATAASLSLSDIGIVVGIVFTVLSFIVTLTFHIRREKRENMHRRWLRRNSEKGQVCETPSSAEAATTHQGEERKR